MALADPRILLRMKQEGFAQAQRDTYSALCIFANPETRQCWPGQRRLHEVAVRRREPRKVELAQGPA